MTMEDLPGFSGFDSLGVNADLAYYAQHAVEQLDVLVSQRTLRPDIHRAG